MEALQCRMAVWSWLSCPGSPFLAVRSWLSGLGCSVLAVLFWLSYSGRHVLNPGFFTEFPLRMNSYMNSCILEIRYQEKVVQIQYPTLCRTLPSSERATCVVNMSQTKAKSSRVASIDILEEGGKYRFRWCGGEGEKCSF
jgi:hypothetical protein